MSLISVKNLSCFQPTKTLFENGTFSIEEKDKVAIIGINGSGKTTLLTQLARSIDDPLPEISTQNGVRITYLPQTVEIDPDHSILEYLFQSNTPEANAIRDYTACVEAFNHSASPQAESALSKAMERMDHANAWEYEERVRSILTELNIHDLSQKMGGLSGGMRKKIALAQAFFAETDVLILDEPTNHLDIKTIEWLESMLKRQASAVIMVTHDRYFLDKICTKIIEIDQQKLFVYNGNYQTYLEQRELRYLAQDKQEKSIQSVLRVELAWLKRGPKARSTKQKARKDRINDMLNRQVLSTPEAISLDVEHRRLGKKILKLTEISKKFGNHSVINSFTYTFKQGERIGIIGPNGVGKTTLLNIIMEKLSPDSGSIDVGVNTVFGYFDQHSEEFDMTMTIYDHVNQIGSHITYGDGSVLSASKLLERFLFPSGMLKTPIGKLSGGERRRLQLVCLLLKNPNFLLFDEPTNDLDIQTLSVLEDFLLSFQGCVIIISHDRYFMDRVVDQLMVFDSRQHISLFSGNYTDYIDTVLLLEDAKKKKKSVAPSVKGDASGSQEPSKKLSFKEKEELKLLEKEITQLESDKKELDTFFVTGSGSASDYEAAGKKLKEITDQLEAKMARWEGLAERAI